MKDIDKIRDSFNHSNITLNKGFIIVWYGRQRGREWIPYSGGPLYDSQAVKAAYWLADHVEKFRSLLPKRIRDWRIRVMETNGLTFSQPVGRPIQC